MGLLEQLTNNDLIKTTIELIKKVYLSNKLPFVVGYSGGKDSTLTLQLIFEALMELEPDQLTNEVFVISSDTLVETPPVINQILKNHKAIQKAAKRYNLPIKTILVKPTGDQTFWANTIGRGYPVPNQTFRWCTDRMKIEPANLFIKEVVSEYGEIIMVLGVLEGESASRDRVLEKHSIDGKVLMKHTTMNNAFVFAPIKSFTIDNVWDYLLSNPSPWGADNKELYNLYANSNSGECPLIIDQETKNRSGSCGNSRLGCWTCTVVEEDKALSSFIESGEEWLRPLLRYRNWLSQNRDNRSMRMKMRTNGAIYFSPILQNDNKFIIPKKTKRKALTISIVEDNKGIDNNGETWLIFKSEKDAKNYIGYNNIDLASDVDPRIIAKMRNGQYGQLGLGPYIMDARKIMLRKLLETQRDLSKQISLITKEELLEIRKLWIEQGDLEDSLPKIYYEVFGKTLELESDDNPFIIGDDLEIVKELCDKHNLDYNLYKKLIYIEKANLGATIRRKAINQLSNLVKQDYLHIGEE